MPENSPLAITPASAPGAAKGEPKGHETRKKLSNNTQIHKHVGNTSCRLGEHRRCVGNTSCRRGERQAAMINRSLDGGETCDYLVLPSSTKSGSTAGAKARDNIHPIHNTFLDGSLLSSGSFTSGHTSSRLLALRVGARTIKVPTRVYDQPPAKNILKFMRLKCGQKANFKLLTT